MTNEEMVMRIKDGRAKDYYISALWDRVYKLANMLATDYYYLHHLSCMSAGVTMDDLKQESYFGFLDAIRYYDPEKGLKFTSYMHFPLLKVFNGLCGVITQRSRNEPLNNAKSLSTPVGEEDLTLEDMLEDKTVGEEFQSIEKLDYTKRLRSDLEECIDTLNDDQAYTIRERYFEGMNFRQIAERHGITEGLCRGRETQALQHLRRGKNWVRLKVYQNDIISRYGYKSSYGLWRSSGCSSTEYTVLKMEKAAERWAY